MFYYKKYYFILVFHISVNSFVVIDRCDDQWTWVFTSIIISVANLATLLLTNLWFVATNLKTLATFQMSPVLSCECEILSYTSPCVCSDQSALAPAERRSTFSDRTAADMDVNQLRMLPRTNHLPASPLFEIKRFNLTVLSFFLLLIVLMHLYYSLSQSFSSLLWWRIAAHT